MPIAKGVRPWNYLQGRGILTAAEARAAGLRPPRELAQTTAQPAPVPGPAPSQPAAPPTPTVDAKIIPFGPRPTLGQALEAVSGPAVGQPTAGSEQPPPPGSAPAPAPAAPTTTTRPLELVPPPPRNDDAEGFADLAGKLATGLGVAVCGGIIRRQGFEPNDPDELDQERLERITAKGIRQRIGDRPIPFWAELASGYALLYLSMKNGAQRLEKPAVSESAPAAAATEEERPPVTAPPPAPPPGRSVGRGGLVAEKPAPVVGPQAA